MATYNPYAAQEADIARRKHMADVLEQQAFKPIQQFSYNGIPAPISPLSGLAKVLSSYGAGKLEREAAAAETKLGANRTAARARSVDMLVKAMGGTPKGEDTPATPGTVPSLGRTFEPVAEGHDPAERPVVIPGTMGTPAVLGAPARPGGVTPALALSLEDSEIQGIALGLVKDERGREQALALETLKGTNALANTTLKGQTARYIAELKDAAGSGDTAAIKEYEYVLALPDDAARERFGTIKRANPILNLGDRMAVMSSLNPGQELTTTYKGAPGRWVVTADGTATFVPAIPSSTTGAAGGAGASTGVPAAPVNVPSDKELAALEKRRNDARLKAATVSMNVDLALELLNDNTRTFPIAGWGVLAASVPNSPQRTLAGALNSIKAQIDLGELRTMRETSTSGASGLGQVTQGEHLLLQLAYGALDQGGDPEVLKRNLKNVQMIFDWVVHDGKLPADLPIQLRAITAQAIKEREAARTDKDPVFVQTRYDELKAMPVDRLGEAALTKMITEMEALKRRGAK